MNTFQLLQQHLGVVPDRRGECHVTCPACGKEAKRGQAHFSFSERGGFCFVCGSEFSLATLAAHYGIEGDEPIQPVERQEKPKGEAPSLDFDYLADQYSHRFGASYYWEKWQSYKPVPVDLVKKHWLGYGAFPKYSSKCSHNRLIVPIFGLDRMVIGLRGRAIDCNCGKWLSPAGSQMFLYNWQTLKDAAGKLLFVVENPIDALMLELVNENVKAVATLGVTIWQDEYTALVADSGAMRVVVAYDHDVPGNGGTPEMRQAWAESHNGKLPPAGGAKVANALLAAGVQAMLLPWPADTAAKTDIGDILEELA